MDKSVKKSITDYITKGFNRGFTKNQIKAKLLKAGFKAIDIDPLLISATHPLKVYYYSLGIICLIILLSLFFFTSKGESLCENTECMIDALQSCSPAHYTFTLEGTTMSVESKDCKIIKTVTGLLKDEPDEIRVLFLDKSMVCDYDTENPDDSYLMTITGGLESCEGDLKESIIDIREAQELIR